MEREANHPCENLGRDMEGSRFRSLAFLDLNEEVDPNSEGDTYPGTSSHDPPNATENDMVTANMGGLDEDSAHVVLSNHLGQEVRPQGNANSTTQERVRAASHKSSHNPVTLRPTNHISNSSLHDGPNESAHLNDPSRTKRNGPYTQHGAQSSSKPISRIGDHWAARTDTPRSHSPGPPAFNGDAHPPGLPPDKDLANDPGGSSSVNQVVSLSSGHRNRMDQGEPSHACASNDSREGSSDRCLQLI